MHCKRCRRRCLTLCAYTKQASALDRRHCTPAHSHRWPIAHTCAAYAVLLAVQGVNGCSGHGLCMHDTGQCECPVGYTGDACESCAQGLTSYLGDDASVCEPDTNACPGAFADNPTLSPATASIVKGVARTVSKRNNVGCGAKSRCSYNGALLLDPCWHTCATILACYGCVLLQACCLELTNSVLAGPWSERVTSLLRHS